MIIRRLMRLPSTLRPGMSSSIQRMTKRMSSTQIHLGHFQDSKHQFGPEATLPITEVREYKTISLNDLSHYLHFTVKALDPEVLRQNPLLQKKPSGLIADVLGSKETYSVREDLEKLRQITQPTSEQKLLQRTLALISFDLLNPFSVEQQNIRHVYGDLHILDRAIMPEPRKGGANGFRSLKLYQDGERRIRFHIYPTGEAESDFIAQDNLAHQHYGHSASIILAGNLVNQHFKATPTDDPATELALYRVRPEYDPTIDPDNAVRSAKTLTYHQGVTVTRVSSHVYKAGEYYQLPKPLTSTEEQSIPYQITESDRLDYHKVGNLGLTATLWSLKYPAQTTEYDFSVLPRTRPQSITIDYKAKNVDKTNFWDLLVATDLKIKKEIADVKKISTVLDRGKREVLASRVRYYMPRRNTLFTPTSSAALSADDTTTHHPIKAILAINIGSSSIKFSLLKLDDQKNPHEYLGGQIDITSEGLKLRIKDKVKKQQVVNIPFANSGNPADTVSFALQEIFNWLKANMGHCQIEAICHRVLHGADKFPQHVKITAEAIKEMEELIPIAPLHQPYNIAGIKCAYEVFADIPQFACFDTAFHATIPQQNRTLPLAEQATPLTVQQYGFHGLSYEYIVSQLPAMIGEEAARGKVIIAHLGGGSTLCAVQDGKSIAATGGLSKLDGVMMGTRSGSVDPGAILYLLNFISTDELRTLLFHNSGLKGVSQQTSDMRVILKSNDEHSQKALELYINSLAENIAKLVTKLGGVDTLVFAGGIGENEAEVRDRVCQRLRWLGVQIDNENNVANKTAISSQSSKVKVLVIPTNENVQMARHTVRMLEVEQEQQNKMGYRKN